ncbi:MAG TPA: glycosyltransferase family 2 protein [Acidimicrobiia bacterium]
MISAVVVAWGQAPFLERCVAQLLASEGTDVEVIVVDNGVVDDSVAALGRDDRLRRVAAPGNLGFGGGCNLGASLATGELMAFVNPDALVEPGALAALAGALDDPTVGIATAQVRLLREPGLVNSAGGAIHFLGLGWAVGYGQPASRAGTRRDVAAASGAAMALRAETFAALQGFTEELFLYHEDADLSWRCWMGGWRVAYIPEAVVFHDYEFTSHPEKLYFLERNRLALVLTCYEARTLCLLAPALLAFEAGMVASATAQGWLGAKVRGWAWLFRHLGWLRQQRARCQRQRREGDPELAGLLQTHFDATHFPSSFPVRVADRFLAAYWATLRRFALRSPSAQRAER